jgi:hypothetical protein
MKVHINSKALLSKNKPSPQLNLLLMYNSRRYENLPSRPSRQICGHLVLPHRSFIGGGSSLCPMMKRLSFPQHAVLSSRISFLFVHSRFLLFCFSLLYLGVVIDWASYRPGTRTTTTYLRFLDSVRLEDMIIPLNSARSLA